MTQNSPDTIVRAARLAERTIQGLTRYGSALCSQGMLGGSLRLSQKSLLERAGELEPFLQPIKRNRDEALVYILHDAVPERLVFHRRPGRNARYIRLRRGGLRLGHSRGWRHKGWTIGRLCRRRLLPDRCGHDRAAPRAPDRLWLRVGSGYRYCQELCAK